MNRAGWRWNIGVAFAAATWACHGVAPAAPGETTADLAVRVDLVGAAVATVVIEVTATDIATPLVFNLIPSNGVATGILTIPAGSQRTVAARAYDAAGILTHSGSVVTAIQGGTTLTLAVAVGPVAGSADITVTLGSFTIAITPAPVSLAYNTTVQLTATIMGPGGQAVNGAVAWGTRDPGIAGVNATGLLTGYSAGTTTVHATFQGATTSAPVTVVP